MPHRASDDQHDARHNSTLQTFAQILRPAEVVYLDTEAIDVVTAVIKSRTLPHDHKSESDAGQVYFVQRFLAERANHHSLVYALFISLL